ncbi:MAG: hypothetical protein PHO41_12025, partial [Eubacteriales bacterium]|nr:hypothetical protein [Eubacteriales bacterium]
MRKRFPLAPCVYYAQAYSRLRGENAAGAISAAAGKESGMGMGSYIGLDVGSSGCKAAVIEDTGKIRHITLREY